MHPVDAAVAAPLCTSIVDLRKHEGAPIRLRGTFHLPGEKAFARNKLILDDGTTVILSRPARQPAAAMLSEANRGVRMIIVGVVYIKDIPARYQLIGRTSDPYLVDIESVTVAP